MLNIFKYLHFVRILHFTNDPFLKSPFELIRNRIAVTYWLLSYCRYSQKLKNRKILSTEKLIHKPKVFFIGKIFRWSFSLFIRILMTLSNVWLARKFITKTSWKSKSELGILISFHMNMLIISPVLYLSKGGREH